MTYEEAFLSELNKVAQGAYDGYPGQMVVTRPPAPVSALKSPKLQKAVGVGKRVGLTSLRIMDQLVREPAKSFSREASVPRSLL